MKRFDEIFCNKKPIIGMLHLKGLTREERFERFKREFAIYCEEGVDAVIVEDYFGTLTDMKQALQYLKENGSPIPYGVNCLNFDMLGFELANEYGADFVQIDSVVGHVKDRDEESLEYFLESYKAKYDVAVFGGVRFKYQPLLSIHTLEEDLRTAMRRVEAICVTETKTGEETSIEKIKQFKDVLEDFPLIVAAGVTLDNIESQLAIADGAIIGSYFKDNRQDYGDLSAEHVREIMNKVKEIRGKLHD
ncbi:MAG: membrane biogenesis protein [Erysipelotrichaceae bacterium]|nr:membrane biogenesis protein [Erysipelotrichaceae bacterium]